MARMTEFGMIEVRRDLREMCRSRAYIAIREAAEQGRPCPSNDELRARFNIRQPSDMIRALNRRGALQQIGRGPRRTIRFPDGLETVSPLEHCEDIAAKAASIFSIPYSKIIGPRGNAHVSRARQAAYLVGVEAGHPTKIVAAALGRDDHATVIYGIGRARAIAERDPNYAKAVDELRRASGVSA